MQYQTHHDTSYSNDDNGLGMQQGAVLSGFDNVYTTTQYYNGFGQLTSAYVQDGMAHSVAFRLDELGQVIRRDETHPSAAHSSQTGEPHAAWYRFAGREMGHVSNNGTDAVSAASSIAERTAPSRARSPRPGWRRPGRASFALHIASAYLPLKRIRSLPQ